MPERKVKFSDKYDLEQMFTGIAQLILLVCIFVGVGGFVAAVAPILLFFTLFFLLIFLFV